MESLLEAHLCTNTDLRTLAQVLAWFDQFNHPTIPHPVWLQCQLALAEGFTNAVRHAHKDQARDTVIEIAVKVSNHSLEIRIWDFGVGFDLEQTLKKMSTELNHDAGGGRGLKLMQRMADQLSYTRTADHRNCLLIVKQF